MIQRIMITIHEHAIESLGLSARTPGRSLHYKLQPGVRAESHNLAQTLGRSSTKPLAHVWAAVVAQ